MTALGDLDRARIDELLAREPARFRQARPRSLAMIGRARAHMPNGTPMAWMASDNDQPVYIDYGHGPGFTDVDGFTYLDFNASGQWYGPRPRTGAEAHALTDGRLTRLVRIWLANRGVWEALPGAGPTVPIPATRADVARYVAAYRELLAQLR